MKQKVTPLALLVVACGGDGFSTSASYVDGGPRGTGGEVVGTGATRSNGGASSGGASNGGAMAGLGGTASGGISASGGQEAGLGGSPGSSGGSGGSSGSTSGVAGSSGGSSGGGGGGVFDACAPVTHDNGLGQTWQDCVPLGTYNLEQAMKACRATGLTDPAGCVINACVGSPSAVCESSRDSRCWGYYGQNRGYVVVQSGICPPPHNSADPIWH